LAVGLLILMLGGEDGPTLFIAAGQWRGMESAMTEGPGLTGQPLAAAHHPSTRVCRVPGTGCVCQAALAALLVRAGASSRKTSVTDLSRDVGDMPG
jgi:hypothetical protein